VRRALFRHELGDDLNYLRKILADDLSILRRLGFYLICGSIPTGRAAAIHKAKVDRV
jgi:hypothetical protein